MKRVAVCHWGLTRTFSGVYETHQKHLYAILDKNNVQYDKYLHTWIHPTNNITDYAPYNFTSHEVEDQTELIQNIDTNISDYWYKHIFDSHGGDSPYEWLPTMLKNSLYGMASLKRVTQMCIDSGIKYDYIIYIRPDCILYSDIDCDFITMDEDTIVVPREHWGGIDMFGINEILIITPFSKCREYGFRFDETKYYRKYVGRIAGEHYVGWIINKYFKNIVYTDVKFDLKRL